MVDKNPCTRKIENGMIVRCIMTLLFLGVFVLSKDSNYRNGIVLVIALWMLDCLDNIFLIRPICPTSVWDYQWRDKFMDTVTYFLVGLVLFRQDLYFWSLFSWRVIGLWGLFATQRFSFLVIFPDVLKEYILYKALWKDIGFPFLYIYILKMAVEYYMHVYLP